MLIHKKSALGYPQLAGGFFAVKDFGVLENVSFGSLCDHQDSLLLNGRYPGQKQTFTHSAPSSLELFIPLIAQVMEAYAKSS